MLSSSPPLHNHSSVIVPPFSVAKRTRIVTKSRVHPSKNPPVVTTLPRACLPADLGKCIAQDIELLQQVGWRRFVQLQRPKQDLGSLNFQHPAKRLLRHYKHRGAPAKFATPPWSPERVQAAMDRGAHRSCEEHLEFLQEEFGDMIRKDQWVILPYSMVKDLPGICLSPHGCVPQRGTTLSHV